MDNVTKSVTDVKVEVRYLTITLFDINDRYREMEKLVQYFNVSTENIKSEIANNEHKQSAALLELKTQHMKTIGKYIFPRLECFSQKWIQFRIGFFVTVKNIQNHAYLTSTHVNGLFYNF